MSNIQVNIQVLALYRSKKPKQYFDLPPWNCFWTDIYRVTVFGEWVYKKQRALLFFWCFLYQRLNMRCFFFLFSFLLFIHWQSRPRMLLWRGHFLLDSKQNKNKRKESECYWINKRICSSIYTKKQFDKVLNILSLINK